MAGRKSDFTLPMNTLDELFSSQAERDEAKLSKIRDTRTYLYITVNHKTVEEMATEYGFNEEQKSYLTELLADENNSLWSQVLYGVAGADDQIVTVAFSQIGNVGGDPYSK